MHLFYQPDPRVTDLNDEEFRHISKVLRLKTGDTIYLTDGAGTLRKCCLSLRGTKASFESVEDNFIPKRPFAVNMAVAPTRKAERNEWMVEKMTELGVERIDFIVTENTNKESLNRVVNLARLSKIAVSAMKQSQQFYLPEITLNRNFNSFIESRQEKTKLIAYVPDSDLAPHAMQMVANASKTILPEGDFTKDEVAFTSGLGFRTVSLGPTRLRTETAAIMGCHALNLANIINF